MPLCDVNLLPLASTLPVCGRQGLKIYKQEPELFYFIGMLVLPHPDYRIVRIIKFIVAVGW